MLLHIGAYYPPPGGEEGSRWTFYILTIQCWLCVCEQVGEGLSGWSIKYYKGLGTSSSQEAKEYFSNLPLHVMDFSWEGAQSGEVCGCCGTACVCMCVYNEQF